jgi:hypothetical protein
MAENDTAVTNVTNVVVKKTDPVPDTTGPDITEVKPAWYWIKDSRGYGSVTVTMVFVAFWITTLAYILSLFEKFGPVQVRPFDVAACSAYFIPILTLYFGRKFTDLKFGGQKGD